MQEIKQHMREREREKAWKTEAKKNNNKTCFQPKFPWKKFVSTNQRILSKST